MKLVSLTRAAVIAALLTPGSAMAASYSLSTSIGPAATELASIGGPGIINILGTSVNSAQLELDKFDSSLGTLNSVTLKLDIDSLSTGTVTNTGGSTTFAQTEVELQTLFGGDGITITPFPLIVTGDANTGFLSFGPGATLPITPLNINVSQSLTTGGGNLTLAEFIGTGTETFGIDYATIVQQSILGGGGNVIASLTTNATIGATVTYDYTAAAVIPLPAGAWLMIGGVGALGALRRRKKAAAAA